MVRKNTMVDRWVFSLNLVTKLLFLFIITNRYMQRVEEHSQRADIKGRGVFRLKTF